ncbi:MAG: hypothetical protein NTY96_02020 [Bacteroidetes bacterium]|nr:hypothetical protein [Bacteroidota bacterium]
MGSRSVAYRMYIHHDGQADSVDYPKSINDHFMHLADECPVDWIILYRILNKCHRLFNVLDTYLGLIIFSSASNEH